nr:hypothetical protein [Lachnospiraceae bacterium]
MTQNPFSTTFSKMPEYTYISTMGPREVIDNFSYDSPSESVYKIVGVRGSGKTVAMAKIQEAIAFDGKDSGWLVYMLNPSRDMLTQMAAHLYNEDFIKEKTKSKGITFNASVMGTGAGIGYIREADDRYFDIGVEIKKMLDIVREKKKKVLILVDEVSKTEQMQVFALEFGGWLIAGYPVYFVCTGLFENVQELGNVKNLTFFRRGTTIMTKPLGLAQMSEMYREKLGVNLDTAKTMATITRGYAYAFQELGALFFKSGKKDSLETICGGLKRELFSYSYEKIWEEMSMEDRALARLLTEKDEYKREEVLKMMGEKEKNYSVYRDRLLKRGIISARQGYIGLCLPYF